MKDDSAALVAEKNRLEDSNNTLQQRFHSRGAAGQMLRKGGRGDVRSFDGGRVVGLDGHVRA